MYFVFSNSSQEKIVLSNIEIEKNLCNFKKYKTISFKNGYKEIDAFEVDHHNVANMHNLTDYILSEKIFKELNKKFGKIYFINLMHITINGFNPDTHRDGQRLGWNKQALEDSEKIFKVVQYLKFEENEPIMLFGRFNSKPFKFFKNSLLFKIINFIIEKYFKSKFLIPIYYKKGDVLVFDQNTWHSPTVPKNFINHIIKKVYVSWEFSLNENSAQRFMKFYGPEDKSKTSLDEYSDIIKNRLLNLKRNNKIEILNYE